MSERLRVLSGRSLGRWLLAVIVVGYAVAYALPATGDRLVNTAPPGVIAVGVVTGTVISLGAMALILTYRSNRFINFAYGSLGSLVGVLAIGLYREHDWPFLLVLPVGVLAGGAVGAAVEVGVIRRFRDAPRLVLTVASIGLAQVLSGFEVVGSKALDFVALTGAFKVPLGLPEFHLGPKTVGPDEMLIVVVAPFVLFGLAWFLRRTDIGVAVRGAAENEARAVSLGIPVRWNTTLVWTIAGAVAALTFILKAPFSGVAPGVASTGPAVLLPALAAAVVARMESLPVALVAGMGLGVVEQVVRWNSGTSPSVIDAIFVVVILAALLVQRKTFSRSNTDDSSWSATRAARPVPAVLARLPEVRIASVAGLVAIALLVVFVPRGWAPQNQLLASFAMVWAMVGISLVVLTGWGGNVSLGQFALVGVGGLVGGNLIADQNLDLLLVMILSGAAGALVALVLGIPGLRVRGPFLAATTIAFAVALDSYVLNVNNFASIIPDSVARPLLFGRYDLEDQYAMYVFCVAVLAAWVAILVGLRRGRTRRALVAARDNERAAAASGVPITRTKLTSFVLAGTIAGVAGALHVQLLHSLSPGSYPVGDSITVFALATIGGLDSIAGAIIGVLAFRYLETVKALGDLRLILTGAGLLFVLYAAPGGFGELLFGVRDRLLRFVAARRGIDLVAAAPPSMVLGLTTDERPVPRPASANGEGAVAPMLRCRELNLGYGQMQIVFDLDFDVAPGEMVALLGTNGAGKSTLLKGICGLLDPRSGSVTFDGHDITGAPAEHIARQGMALMPGGVGVFPGLSVDENLRLAAWGFRKDRAEIDAARQRVYELFPVLGVRQHQLARDLSGGEQQMLALSIALLSKPKLLLIDELSLGLSPVVVGQLCEVVRDIHRSGTTVVIVEQSANLAVELADRAVFMEKGMVRFDGPTAELLQRPDLLRSVFLGEARAPTKSGRRKPLKETGGTIVECRQVVRRFGGITAVDDVDLALHDNEILGLIGHNGAGKTTLLDCISGFLPVDGGRVLLDGDDITDLPAQTRARRGMARSFQDARLFPTLTVADAVAVARERHLASRSVLADGLQLPASYESELVVHRTVDELVELMGLRAFRDRFVGELSTGTRRLVDLACALAHEPTVLLLDEPSSGIAQKESEALRALLLQVREHTGCAMLIIEHDLSLLRAVADRLIALELGAVIAEGSPDDVLAHPRVIESYLGTPQTVA